MEHQAVQIDSLVASPQTEVLLDFNMDNEREDHCPMAAVFRPLVSTRAPIFRRRVAGYTRDAVQEPARTRACTEMLQAMPPFPFALEPTSHCHIVDSYVAAAAVEAYGRPVRKPRQPFISESAFRLIRDRGLPFAHCHTCGRRIKWSAVCFGLARDGRRSSTR